jgi:glycosyltransferase involved in cell wall biosynthesis
MSEGYRQKDHVNHKMKIVYICSVGVNAYWINLANAVSKKCDLHLFLPDNIDRINTSLYLEKTVNIHFFKKFKFYDPRNIVSMLKLYRKILEKGPSLIHLPGGIPFSLLIIYPLIKLKYPLIITCHEPIPYILKYLDLNTHERVPPFYSIVESFPSRLMVQINMRMADAVVVATKFLEKETAQYWKRRKFKIFAVPFGPYIHYTKLIKSTVEEDANTVLFFGGAGPGKGLGYLIKAQPTIANEIKDLKVIIAGRGSSRYKEMIENPEQFEIYGHVEDEKLCELFQRASVVVLPYFGKLSQSGVLFTAYAFLKPVVVTNVGCLPESVSNGETGLIIPPNSVEALSDAIIMILKDHKMRKRMKENILEKVTNDWDKISEMMLDVYHQTVMK